MTIAISPAVNHDCQLFPELEMNARGRTWMVKDF
jgi:hypothetical protein